jgi:EmrB/QacA subfamily drug resistance transporter
MFMSMMDTQIVNVALPSIARAFDSRLAAAQWAVVGYALSIAVVLPASGWISDRYGSKRVFLVALALFTSSSAFCGAAHDLEELVAARVVQGIGAGLLIPAGTAILYRAFPPERRARVARLVIVPVIFAPAIAPVLGGALTDAFSWRYVFLVNLPVGVAVFAFAAVQLKEQRRERPGAFDFMSLGLSAIGLTALLYAIGQGELRGWRSPSILASGLGGVLTLLWFVRLERSKEHPVLDVRLLRDRLFRGTMVVTGLNTGCVLGVLYLTPVFLQEALHQSALGSGITTFVEALGALLASQSLARLYPRVGPRVMAAAGSAGVAAVLVSFLWVGATTSLWIVRLRMFLLGAVNVGTVLALQSSMFTNIPRELTTDASTIYVTQRQVSIAIGIAVLTSIVSGASGTPVQRFHIAYAFAAGIAALTIAVALTLIHTVDALPSMANPVSRRMRVRRDT